MGTWLPRLLARTPPVIKRLALVAALPVHSRGVPLRHAPAVGSLSGAMLAGVCPVHCGPGRRRAARRGDLSELQERLYRNAYRLGRTTGWLLRVQGVDDVMAFAHLLYGILDIELQGSGSGEITISRCYFSSFYLPQVCQVMSAMDRGLLAGLAGAGNLIFTQRIAEGWPCCRARFTLASDPSSGRL